MLTTLSWNILTLVSRWHIFTAIGGYTAVVIVDKITSGEVLGDPAEGLAWPIPLAAKYIMPNTNKLAKQS